MVDDSEDKELAIIMEKKMKEMASRTKETEVAAQPSPSYGSGSPVAISDNDFDAHVARYPVFVVDCWADWCGPCKMLAPIVEELARDFKGKIVFGKLDVDSNPMTPSRYRVTGIPTLLIFRNGRYIDRIIGYQPKAMLFSIFNRFLSQAS